MRCVWDLQTCLLICPYTEEHINCFHASNCTLNVLVRTNALCCLVETTVKFNCCREVNLPPASLVSAERSSTPKTDIDVERHRVSSGDGHVTEGTSHDVTTPTTESPSDVKPNGTTRTTSVEKREVFTEYL